jgi:hypothetical protein
MYIILSLLLELAMAAIGMGLGMALGSASTDDNPKYKRTLNEWEKKYRKLRAGEAKSMAQEKKNYKWGEKYGLNEIILGELDNFKEGQKIIHEHFGGQSEDWKPLPGNRGTGDVRKYKATINGEVLFAAVKKVGDQYHLLEGQARKEDLSDDDDADDDDGDDDDGSKSSSSNSDDDEGPPAKKRRKAPVAPPVASGKGKKAAATEEASSSGAGTSKAPIQATRKPSPRAAKGGKKS